MKKGAEGSDAIAAKRLLNQALNLSTSREHQGGTELDELFHFPLLKPFVTIDKCFIKRRRRHACSLSVAGPF